MLEEMSTGTKFQQQRSQLVKELRGQGIGDARVLEALGSVPREEFVGPEFASCAYLNKPLPIGSGQTISQPYVVAWMLEALQLRPEDKVLEIGGGSGYAAATLSCLVDKVYSVERHPELARTAQERLNRLGYAVTVWVGDGSIGLPEFAPYDAILVSAGAPNVPTSLLKQLRVGGRLVIPVGQYDIQSLVRVERNSRGYRRQHLGDVRFVPLVGAEGWEDP